MKVLVVGAGPAGATTALLLARYGVDVTLVERETSFERVFRGEGLMPLGMDALFQMGLQEALESVPYRLVLSWNIWINGEEAFTAPRGAGTGGRPLRSWRFGLAKRGARLLGRYRWAQNAWLRRQNDLRFGSTEVKLQISP